MPDNTLASRFPMYAEVLVYLRLVQNSEQESLALESSNDQTVLALVHVTGIPRMIHLAVCTR